MRINYCFAPCKHSQLEISFCSLNVVIMMARFAVRLEINTFLPITSSYTYTAVIICSNEYGNRVSRNVKAGLRLITHDIGLSELR